MNSGDENILSRWSRRKIAARQSGPPREADQPDRPALADGETERAESGTGEAASAEASPETAETEIQTTEPLPRLEDLRADSDLSSFLRDGVPATLRNSALRKMWSLDPAIRDHVGMAEYAWDFNAPGSMNGFGPLEAGKRTVDFLSTVARAVLPGEDDEFVDAAQPGRKEAPTEEAGAPSEARTEIAAPEPEASGSEHVKATAEPAVEGAESPLRKLAESAPGTLRRRHGGALPR